MNEHVRPRGDVYCRETGEVYKTVAEAARELGLNAASVYDYLKKSDISKPLYDEYTFEYVYDQTGSIRGRKLQR